MIAVGTAVLLSMRVADHLNQQGDGTVTVSYADGTVLSVQPDGRFETRPAGTAGPYERAVVHGWNLVYAPLGNAGPAFVVPYAAQLPNA